MALHEDTNSRYSILGESIRKVPDTRVGSCAAGDEEAKRV